MHTLIWRPVARIKSMSFVIVPPLVISSEKHNDLHIFTGYIIRELSGRVLDSRPRGRGFEPHRCHCVVVLEQDSFILA